MIRRRAFLFINHDPGLVTCQQHGDWLALIVRPSSSPRCFPSCTNYTRSATKREIHNVFAGLTFVTNRPRYTCNNRPRLMQRCRRHVGVAVHRTRVVRQPVGNEGVPIYNWHSAGSPGWPFPMLKYEPDWICSTVTDGSLSKVTFHSTFEILRHW